MMRDNCGNIFLDGIIKRNTIIPVGVIRKDILVQDSSSLQLLLNLSLSIKSPAFKTSLHKLKDSLHTLSHAGINPSTGAYQLLQSSPTRSKNIVRIPGAINVCITVKYGTFIRKKFGIELNFKKKKSEQVLNDAVLPPIHRR